MTRRSRQESSTGIYHVILRTVNQQQLFEEDSDYTKFLLMLSDCKKKYSFKIYAYCLMSNHIHLIVDSPLNILSIAFNSFSVRFVQWYNRKYERFGHLYQARFWSKPIESTEQFLQTIYYIHANPVKANICPYASDYRWSSIGAYYSKKDSLVSTEMAVSILGSLENVQKYFSQCSKFNVDLANNEAEPVRKYIPDTEALRIFKETTNCKSPNDFQNLRRIERLKFIKKMSDMHLTHNQISRLCGISRKTVYNSLK